MDPQFFGSPEASRVTKAPVCAPRGEPGRFGFPFRPYSSGYLGYLSLKATPERPGKPQPSPAPRPSSAAWRRRQDGGGQRLGPGWAGFRRGRTPPGSRGGSPSPSGRPDRGRAAGVEVPGTGTPLCSSPRRSPRGASGGDRAAEGGGGRGRRRRGGADGGHGGWRRSSPTVCASGGSRWRPGLRLRGIPVSVPT